MMTCLIASYSQAQTQVILARALNTPTWQYFNIKGEVIVDRRAPMYYQFTEDGFALVGEDIFTIIYFHNIV